MAQSYPARSNVTGGGARFVTVRRNYGYAAAQDVTNQLRACPEDPGKVDSDVPWPRPASARSPPTPADRKEIPGYPGRL